MHVEGKSVYVCFLCSYPEISFFYNSLMLISVPVELCGTLTTTLDPTSVCQLKLTMILHHETARGRMTLSAIIPWHWEAGTQV